MRKTTLLLSLCLLLPGVAAAHGPVRQKLDKQIEIHAAPSKVWNLIKDFGDMSWHPQITNVTVEGGNQEGAKRVLTLQDGGTITEELKKYSADKMEYSYKINEMSVKKTIEHSGEQVPVHVLPVSNYTATIGVKGQGDHATVTWKAAYYRGYMNNKPPADLNEDAANSAVDQVLQAGLDNLKKLAEQ